MIKKVGENTIKFTLPPKLISGYSIVGPKEGQSPLASYFDYILKNDTFNEKTYERAERKMLEQAISGAIDKANLLSTDIDILLSGDLLNQIISASFSARQLQTSFIGMFGACSTMTESLAVGACLIDGGCANNVACATCSHFSTAERQFRFPLELGCQRPPTAQWTVTGAGCSIVSREGTGHNITHVTFGKVIDYGIKDMNNMGAAMAPAACDTLKNLFKDTNTTPSDYDLIVTGDLGKLGSEILVDLLELFVRPFSLALRLFANILAGEILVFTFASMCAYFVPLPFMAFEIFVALIQALVFTLLSTTYIALAVNKEE